MSDISKSLKSKADKMFSDMSDKFVDAAETDRDMYGFPSSSSVAKERKYYPQLTIPRTEDYDKQPGDMCNVIAVACVKSVNEKTITLEIQKVIDLPSDAESTDEDDEETE